MGYEIVDGGRPDWGQIAGWSGTGMLVLMAECQREEGAERYQELQAATHERVPHAVMEVVADECRTLTEQVTVYLLTALLMLSNIDELLEVE